MSARKNETSRCISVCVLCSPRLRGCSLLQRGGETHPRCFFCGCCLYPSSLGSACAAVLCCVPPQVFGVCVSETAEEPRVGSEGLHELPNRSGMVPRARGYGPSGCCVACYILARWDKVTLECCLSDQLKPQHQTEDVVYFRGNFLLYPFILLDHS